ncbi:MAG: radical SAM protein [Pseudomonadota bacterium]
MSWRIIAENRRLLAQEQGAVIKDWGGKIPVALAFAHHYWLGMSNLGFQSIYGLFNSYSDVVCERFFVPEASLLREYNRTKTPLLSLETQRPLYEFELIAFSLSHENDYPGVVKILKLGGLPWRAEHRSRRQGLVLAGGVTMRSNPEPLAEFIDLALIGDGEVIVPKFLQAWREVRFQSLPKTELLLHLARQVPGAYAPALYEAAFNDQGRLVSFHPRRSEVPPRVKVARAETLPRPALSTQILTSETEFSGTRLVEIGRGCTRGCRFCLAGFTYRPPRTAPLESVLSALPAPASDRDRVGLISPAVADHPQLETLVRALSDQGREVTVSSLRVEALSPGLVEALRLGRQKSAAIAPEAGSQRLRDFINKGLTEEQILEGAGLLAQAGVRNLKLYFMLGLPSETDRDAQAVAVLTEKIRGRLKKAAGGRKSLPRITLSLSSFSPKPFTPFQIEPMADLKVLGTRAQMIKDALRGQKGVSVQFDPPRWTYLQTLFSRGHRRLSTLIETLADSGGSLSRARKSLSFDPDPLVWGSREENAVLPWSFLDHGFKDDYLENELARARNHRLTPPCPPEACRLCGVCSDQD